MNENQDSNNAAKNPSGVDSESPSPALERCPYCHTAYVEGSTDTCPKSPALGWHEFVPGTICNVKMCDRCDEPYENPVHHTGVVPTEESERILKRRRAMMPNYDERLEEWLS